MMINNGGKLEFTIPTDIAPGNYLLRGEIIALHSAYNLDGAQPYVGMLKKGEKGGRGGKGGKGELPVVLFCLFVVC